tara:strand:+ start:2703 stop:2918 length:216 start_codon:yes stop_codon:yes gene_type:complete
MNEPQRDMLTRAIVRYGLWSFKLGQLSARMNTKDPRYKQIKVNKFWIERDKQIKKIENYLDCEIDFNLGED